jgi:hypothetical protein
MNTAEMVHKLAERISRDRYEKALHEMLHHAAHTHPANSERDMTTYAHGMTAEQVGELLADQPGNKGRKPDEMQKKWVTSTKFVPMRVPIHAVHPVRVPSGRTKSHTVGPIVVEDNFRGKEQILAGDIHPDGFIPPTLIIDGQHRHNDAKNAGETHINALVGEKAVPKILGAMLQHETRERYQKKLTADKYARQLFQRISGPMLFCGEWF